MNQTVPYGNLIIYSSSNGQFSANIKHKQSHLSHYFPVSIHQGVRLQIKRFCDQLEQDEFNSTLWKSDLLLFKAHQQQKQRAENGA